MDALNTDCVIDSPGVAGSVRVHEAYEKMIVAALKGTQLLLAENKHLLAMQCPQIVNRLHICIFAMGARFAASVPANVAGVDGSRTSRSTATRGRDKDEKARSNSVSSWRSRGAAASGGSDSEMSDVESVTHHERFTIEKVRLNALYTLQALAKAHSKLVYAKWPLFLARPSPLQMHPGPSLFSLTGHTVPRRVRLAAVLVIQAFLDGSKQYLAVAEGGKKETPSQTFTSLSQKLADTVTDVHVVLLALVAGEKDAGLRVALLKCLAVLVRNSPYARLTVQDLRREVFDVCLALRDGDEAVCCAQLQVVHDLLDAGFSIPSEHTKQAVLEQFVKPHLSSGIEVKAVAALDLLSSLARNQVTSLDGEWESFVGPFVLRPILQSSGVADIIRVACFKFLEQHAGAAMELFNRKEGSEVTRIRWWSDLIETWVKPALSDSLFALRALALDTLAHVPPMCFQDLPTDLQLLCTDQLLYMLKDPNESVRSSCSATLGQFVTVEYFSRNTNFIDSLARRLAVLVGDADLLVRIRASWALANLADCVVTHSDVLAGVLDEELYRDLMASFVLFARDNEKCRSNGVRGIGGLLRIANQACVEIQVQDAIECICKNVRWNACYAAYNLFNGVSLHRLKDASSHHNRLASLINALITALKTSKNYKVKINAAQALGVPTVYDNAAQIEQMIWVLREARGYLDDLSDTSFGEFKYRSQLDTQLKKSLLTLKVACRDLGQ
ncbi:hypothetical protein BC830DRAFT_17017 [Chytriomyces sp. MP71]|nr:hypothetical protein BC830DRAFT_17017 [Chytriomyces sp. MP71]